MRGAGFKMILGQPQHLARPGHAHRIGGEGHLDHGSGDPAGEFAYEKNAALMTGTAAARRVGFGVKVDSIQDLTIDGFKLLMAAVEWAGGP